MTREARPGKRATASPGRRRRKTSSDRFNPRHSIYLIQAQHLTDLAQGMEGLGELLSPSEPADVKRVRAMTSRLARDSRYSAIKSVFSQIEALVRAGDVIRAWELEIAVVNAVWERSQEYEVARDAFFRRIRGKDFNPIRYLDPLTSDRGAALARIMQADKEALQALGTEPARPKEFVIELAGDYDIIRVIRD